MYKYSYILYLGNYLENHIKFQNFLYCHMILYSPKKAYSI